LEKLNHCNRNLLFSKFKKGGSNKMRKGMILDHLKRAGFLIFALIFGLFYGPLKVEGSSSEKPIIIGMPTSLYTAHARDHKRALELIVDELNARGGIKVDGIMRKFKVVFTDTRDSEPGVPVHDAIMAAEKLILKEKPDFLVGAFHRSEALLAAMDMLADYKIITFSGSPQTPLFTNRIKENPIKYKYLFRPVCNAISVGMFWGNLLGHINRTLNLNKLFFIAIDFEWAKATSKSFEGIAKKAGWEIVGSDFIPAGQADFSAALGKARKAGAEMIILLHDLPESPICLKQWKAMKIPSMLAVIWTPAVDGPRSWQLYGDTLNYSIAAEFPAGGSFPVKALPGSEEWINSWLKKYGEPPETSASKAASYTAMRILVDAINRVGRLDRDALADAILETDLKDVSGRIRFDKESHQLIVGDDPSQGMIFAAFQWLDGKRIVIYPKVIADSDIKLPPWMKK
jgi:branched-chain amino acid transport system substrate-binding protein